MARKTVLTAALLLAATTVAAAEPAATLGQAEGTVLVNQGEAFRTATAGQALQAGDRVMLMEGASATLTFADGCLLPLEAGSLLEVPALSTCAGAVANVQKLGPTLAQAETEGSEDEPAPAPRPEKPFLQTPGGIAVVVAGIGLLAAAGGGSGGDDRPASP